MESNEKNRIPYTCTPEYHREFCQDCACATCYLQEFCDRCADCRELSLLKKRCNAYEGALTY